MPFGCGSASQTPTDRHIEKYIARHMKLKIISKQRNQATNLRYGKPKRTLVEKDTRSVAPGRSLVIKMDTNWEAQLDEGVLLSIQPVMSTRSSQFR